MARQVISTLIDDLDGKKADRTVEFSLDGVNYTIDLSEANAGKLRKALDPYINAGTRLGRSTGRIPARRSGPARTAGSRDENRLIREWAVANGHQISERGRIPQGVSDAYRAANGRLKAQLKYLGGAQAARRHNHAERDQEDAQHPHQLLARDRREVRL